MDIEAVQPKILDRGVARNGANWFYWLAALSVINTLGNYLLGFGNTPFGFGFTQWIDGSTGPLTSQSLTPQLATGAMIVNLLVALGFAGFGYLARRGNDSAWVIGLLFYVVDAMFSIGLRDFFGFSFHLVGFFFLFRGLLASRHVRENATSY